MRSFRKITLILGALLGSITGSNADTTFTVDSAANWQGYMNVFNLPADGGAYQFGSGWGKADLVATFSGSTLTLAPNVIGDPNGYWYIGGGAPGHPGNKIMDANMYVEQGAGAFANTTITFTGKVISNTFTNAHPSVAFIKDFSGDYSSSRMVTAPLVNGVFSISLAIGADPGRHIQYGFETIGVNVWVTDVGPFGSAQIEPVSTDPYAAWIAGFNFSGFTNPDLTKSGDPDRDGQNNLTEFALNSNPTIGTASGKTRCRVREVFADPALVLTLPVRGNPNFIGPVSPAATVDNIQYTIEGTSDLKVFEEEVTEVFPADTDSMPALDSGWSYHSFRLAGTVGVDGRGPVGFLRARLETVP